MKASYVEWISGGIESVPRGAACALTGVIARSRRRGPPSSLTPPSVTSVTGAVQVAYGPTLSGTPWAVTAPLAGSRTRSTVSPGRLGFLDSRGRLISSGWLHVGVHVP
jgi:hypothetical protein